MKRKIGEFISLAKIKICNFFGFVIHSYREIVLSVFLVALPLWVLFDKVLPNIDFEKNATAWLEFFSSYFGGIITFVSVVITLLFYQNHLKEEKRLSIIPYLRLTTDLLPQDYDWTAEMASMMFATSIDLNNPKTKYNLNIENLGLGNIINLYIPYIGKITNGFNTPYHIKIGETIRLYFELEHSDFINNEDDLIMAVIYFDLLGNKYEELYNVTLTLIPKLPWYKNDRLLFYVTDLKSKKIKQKA